MRSSVYIGEVLNASAYPLRAAGVLEHSVGFLQLAGVIAALTVDLWISSAIERHQLPGVIRIRRRVLLRADDLLNWLDQKRAPSPEE